MVAGSQGMIALGQVKQPMKCVQSSPLLDPRDLLVHTNGLEWSAPRKGMRTTTRSIVRRTSPATPGVAPIQLR